MQLSKHLPLLLILLLLQPFTLFGEEIKPNTEVVELVGRFVKPEYKEYETDKKGRYYAIELDSPVSVSGDEYGGPIKEVKLMQLVFLGVPNSTKSIVKKYTGKRIKVKGTLFYAMTAHHMTQVLLAVNLLAVKEIEGQ